MKMFNVLMNFSFIEYRNYPIIYKKITDILEYI